MFLAIDVGNSQTTIGLIENGSVERRWRLKTDRLDTSDELDAALRSFLALDGIALADVHAAAVASVVPVLTDMWRNALAHALGKEPFIVSAAEVRGIEVAMPYPSQIGADRIADAVEARGTYGSPAIVVDFGTATNIDVVDARGRYRGGCIAPRAHAVRLRAVREGRQAREHSHRGSARAHRRHDGARAAVWPRVGRRRPGGRGSWHA